MPFPAAVLVTFAGGLIGALADKVLGHDVLTLFAAGLTLGAIVATATVRRTHLLGAALSPPLVWLLLVVAGAVYSHPGGLSFTVLSDFIVKAPAVLVATGLAAVVGLARRFLIRTA